MNKNKLRSLMFHAGFCNEDGGWDTRPIHEQEHDNFQRFAELIVRECAGVVAKDMDYHANWCGDKILKHFKIENE